MKGTEGALLLFYGAFGLPSAVLTIEEASTDNKGKRLDISKVEGVFKKHKSESCVKRKKQSFLELMVRRFPFMRMRYALISKRVCGVYASAIFRKARYVSSLLCLHFKVVGKIYKGTLCHMGGAEAERLI